MKIFQKFQSTLYQENIIGQEVITRNPFTISENKNFIYLSPISIRIPVAFYILIFNKLKLFIPHFIHLYRTFVLKYQ